MRIFLRALTVLLALWSQAAAGQDAVEGPHGTRARAFVEAEGEIYVGQLIRIFVEITTPTWFTKAPDYPELRLDGAIVLLPEQLGINFSERVDGQTIAGQRQRYVVIPQRAGRIEVPSLTVRLATAANGKSTEHFSVATEPLVFDVILPPEAVGVSPLVTTASLSLEERYEGALENLEVGDAITRRVTIRAKDTFGLALPPTRFDTVDGLRVYPALPNIEDKVSRGQYSTVRSDAATYILQEPGDYVLPRISVRWWNPETKSLETRTLDEQPISVAAKPAATKPDASSKLDLESSAKHLKTLTLSALDWFGNNVIWLTCIAGALVLLRLAWRRFGPPMVAAFQARRAAALHSERHYFAKLRHACFSGGADQVAQAFWRWTGILTYGDRVPELKQLIDQADDPEIALAFEKMAGERYSRHAEHASLRGLDTYYLVSNFRRRLLDRRRRHHSAAAGTVLNPRS